MNIIELATAVVVLLTAVVAWRSNRRTKEISESVEQVHVIVNSRMTAVLARVEQLTAALEADGVDVPADPDDP